MNEPYLDFFSQISFEARPDDFPLTGLETVRDGRDGADVVGHGEEDQFLVDEIGIRNHISSMSWLRYMPGCKMVNESTNAHMSTRRVRARTHLELSQPLLMVIWPFLAKREIDEIAVARLRRAERDHMLRHVREVVAGI
jgi:hypothetical protein